MSHQFGHPFPFVGACSAVMDLYIQLPWQMYGYTFGNRYGLLGEERRRMSEIHTQQKCTLIQYCYGV